MGEFFESLYDELSLYVRQSAWLNAIPEEPRRPQIAVPGQVPKKVEPASRLKRMTDDGELVPLPDVATPYLIGYLWEVGPTIASGMGDGPLTFGEITSWMERIGLDLEPWESRFLRRLSIDYLVQSQKSTKPECPPPYGVQTRRIYVAKKIDEFFG